MVTVIRFYEIYLSHIFEAGRQHNAINLFSKLDHRCKPGSERNDDSYIHAHLSERYYLINCRIFDKKYFNSTIAIPGVSEENLS